MVAYLMVVRRTRAVGAEVAVDRVARVAFVGVHFQIAFGQGEGLLGSESVEGVFAAGLHFAGEAMAENVALGVGIKVDFVLDGAAVALALVSFGHSGGLFWCGLDGRLVGVA